MTDDADDKPSFIPAEHLAAVGRIANAWAAFEFSIDSATWRLAKVPDMVGACMTAQMFSAQAKFKAFLALAELYGVSDATLKAFRAFNEGEVSGLQEKRNRAVHDYRLINKPTKKVVRLQITAQKVLVFGFHPEPFAELDRTRKQIEALVRKFQKLRDALYAEIDSLPKKAGRPLYDIRPHSPAPEDRP
ncbi:MAG: hypothetical protein ACXU82_16180 [Caulobacteraceae bacterium]